MPPRPEQPRTNLDLAELRRLASAATPGPWSVRGKHEVEATGVTIICGAWNEYGCGWEPNAAYIAAANPATILRLLDLLEGKQPE